MLIRMFNKINGPQIPKWIQIEQKQFNEKKKSIQSMGLEFNTKKYFKNSNLILKMESLISQITLWNVSSIEWIEWKKKYKFEQKEDKL